MIALGHVLDDARPDIPWEAAYLRERLAEHPASGYVTDAQARAALDEGKPRADQYGPWLDMDPAAASTALSTALKPFKVPTRQLTIGECCGGAKGVRYTALPTPEDSE